MKKGTIAIIVGVILISFPFILLQIEKSQHLAGINQYYKDRIFFEAKQDSIVKRANDSLYAEWVSSHDTIVGEIVAIESKDICHEVVDTIWSHPYHSRDAWHSEAIRYAKKKSIFLRKKPWMNYGERWLQYERMVLFPPGLFGRAFRWSMYIVFICAFCGGFAIGGGVISRFRSR